MTDKTPDDKQQNEAKALRARVRDWKKLRFQVRGMKMGKKISAAWPSLARTSMSTIPRVKPH
jgi:hypothetical protein